MRYFKALFNSIIDAMAAQKPLRGIQFRVTNAETGKRSTTDHGKAIVAACIAASAEPSAAASAAAVTAESNWRFGYMPHVVEATVLASKSSASGAMDMARAGLDAALAAFEFHAADGTVTSLAAAMGIDRDAAATAPGSGSGLVSATIAGASAFSAADVALRVPCNGETLEGAAILATAQRWTTSGAMEPSCVAALRRVVENADAWLDLRGAPAFVLLGATSEMGPLEFLLARGATVVAVARPGAAKWDKLIATARGSCGTLIIPIAASVGMDVAAADDGMLAAAAGCDLLTQTPAIADWLVGVAPGEAPTVCSHVYLDGEKFVRASIAMDVVVRAMEARRSAPPTLAYIDTPSHAHVVPQSVLTEAQRHLDARPLWQRVCYAFGMLKPTRVVPTAPLAQAALGDATPWSVIDMLSSLQGPNYALAKFVQRWRAMVAMGDPGRIVSINSGPPARTVSVMHSATMATAIAGFAWLPPNAAYDPETVSPLMAALLVHDLNTAASVPAGAHPLMRTYDQAWHGGSWACPYEPNSSGKVAFMAGKLSGN